MKRFLLSLLGLLLPTAVSAYSITDTGWSCDGFLYCGSGGDVVTIMTMTIVNGVAMFIGALAVVVFFYGAILMVTSQGQEGKEAGKKAMIYASLGLAAALLTSAIIAFVRDYIYYLGG